MTSSISNDSHPSPRLERAKVIDAALELLNESGFDGLSLRRLAAKVGVKAAALYWHFENKQDLVDQLAARIIQEEYERHPLPAGSDWQHLLEALATHTRDALERYREGALVVAKADLRKALNWKNREALIAQLTNQGLSTELALTALFTVSRFTLGYVFEIQADPRTSQGANRSQVSNGHTDQQGHLFSQGLAIIVAGIGQQRASQQA
jgi:TetR/AcrR family tetracycline transcriptional repressor